MAGHSRKVKDKITKGRRITVKRLLEKHPKAEKGKKSPKAE